METEIIVPDVIILKSDVAERTIRLENCHSQNEIMEHLNFLSSAPPGYRTSVVSFITMKSSR